MRPRCLARNCARWVRHPYRWLWTRYPTLLHSHTVRCRSVWSSSKQAQYALLVAKAQSRIRLTTLAEPCTSCSRHHSRFLSGGCADDVWLRLYFREYDDGQCKHVCCYCMALVRRRLEAQCASFARYSHHEPAASVLLGLRLQYVQNG